MLLCFMAALVIAVVAFLGTAHYARKETVIGLITPAEGAVRILAQRSGIISRVWVQDGQRVVAGQRLIDVSYDPTLQSGGALSDLAFANLAREIAAFEDGAAARAGE
jgi:membrane fusion protein